MLCPTHISTLKSAILSSKCSASCKDHLNKSGYKCDSCSFCVHSECININIPSLHKHPLELNINEYESCCLCGTRSTMNYQCSKCTFGICIDCAKEPLTFNQPKAHEHELHQIPRELSFTCDACGLYSTGCPLICHQCHFIIHRDCIFLPRVIYINRHDHRIYHVSSLGTGNWICGVCYEPVNGECGAYSCLICLFVVHSKCAAIFGVNWDGIELEGVPEDDDDKEANKLFEVIDQNVIKHFTHEHNLKASILSKILEEDVLPHCYACTLPLYSELCYRCTQCDFILHQECANLPKKKRHAASDRQLLLCVKGHYKNIKGPQGENFENYFICYICQRYCTGFSYSDGSMVIDVRCASVPNTLKHESHPNWLFISNIDQRTCKGCKWISYYNVCCNGKDDCGGFWLCFRCVTLPTVIKHRYDDHPLSLSYGDKYVHYTYSCGICEEEIYPQGWFYRCNDCASTLHTECVFNNLLHSRPGYSLAMRGRGTFYLLPNNHLSRPICYRCKSRCKGDLVLNCKEDTKAFLCCFCGLHKLFIV